MDSSTLQRQHEEDVQRICAQVKKFHQEKRQFRVYHGSTSSTRPMSFRPGSIVNTSGLTRIYPIDKTNRTVKVEPKVPMDALVEATLPHGLVPAVVMELMGITVGGGYSGTSGESSSFKYGFFEHTINEIEIVLGDGTLTTASRTFQPDLLEWAGSSLGTFGVVTLLEVQLVDAKPFIKLDLYTILSPDEAVKQMERACDEPKVDFVDGILFNKNLGTVMLGSFADKSPSTSSVPVQSFSRRSDPWFTNFVEDLAYGKLKGFKQVSQNKSNDHQKSESTKSSTTSESPTPRNTDSHATPSCSILIPTKDYLFRYDRGCFWGGKLAFQYFHMPFNRLTRWVLDPLMYSRVCYQALHEGGFASQYIVQDFGMPRSKVSQFIDYLSTDLGLTEFQFFLCPTLQGRTTKILDRLRLPPSTNTSEEEMKRTINDERTYGVGVYGASPSNCKSREAFLSLNRTMESQVWNTFLGAKLLYARAYYTESEFWSIYDQKTYEEMRVKYKASTASTNAADAIPNSATENAKLTKILPDVYDKISQDMNSGRKPRFGEGRISGVYGAAKAWWGLVASQQGGKGREYLMQKRDKK